MNLAGASGINADSLLLNSSRSTPTPAAPSKQVTRQLVAPGIASDVEETVTRSASIAAATSNLPATATSCHPRRLRSCALLLYLSPACRSLLILIIDQGQSLIHRVRERRRHQNYRAWGDERPLHTPPDHLSLGTRKEEYREPARAGRGRGRKHRPCEGKYLEPPVEGHHAPSRGRGLPDSDFNHCAASAEDADASPFPPSIAGDALDYVWPSWDLEDVRPESVGAVSGQNYRRLWLVLRARGPASRAAGGCVRASGGGGSTRVATSLVAISLRWVFFWWTRLLLLEIKGSLLQRRTRDRIRPDLQVRWRPEKLLNISRAGIGIVIGHPHRIRSLPPLICQLFFL